MKAYVISLARAAERREYIKAHVESRGVPYQLIEAIDGREAGLLVAYPHDNFGQYLASGYAALVLSWNIALQAAIAGGEEINLILEDDAELCEDFLPRCEQLLKEAPEDWEIIYLGWHGATVEEQVSPSLARARWPIGTYGILIKSPALPKVVECMSRVVSPTDVQLVHTILPSSDFYVATPPLVEHNGEFAQLGHRDHDNWSSIPGTFEPWEHLTNCLADLPQGSKVVEVGSWLGRSSAYLGSHISEGVELFCVDHWRGSASSQEERAFVEDSGGSIYWQWHSNMIRTGNRHKIATRVGYSVDISHLFEDQSLDLVILDGDPYEREKDIVAWARKVKPSGKLIEASRMGVDQDDT